MESLSVILQLSSIVIGDFNINILILKTEQVSNFISVTDFPNTSETHKSDLFITNSNWSQLS